MEGSFEEQRSQLRFDALKKIIEEFPLWLSSTNPASIHEDESSIPGLAQKDLAQKDLALLWLWHRLAAAAPI